MYGVLKPAEADYRGTVVLTGTPGNLIKGLFFDVTTGREAGWSGHRFIDSDKLVYRFNSELPGNDTRIPGFWRGRNRGDSAISVHVTRVSLVSGCASVAT